mmetsp:Transcript_9129/g.22671  ORF Transcript_9129/g.22671 Transcript_9129/m.22671 type:complete len:87 (-) Transcript_9129:78-338(-)
MQQQIPSSTHLMGNARPIAPKKAPFRATISGHSPSGDSSFRNIVVYNNSSTTKECAIVLEERRRQNKQQVESHSKAHNEFENTRRT